MCFCRFISHPKSKPVTAEHLKKGNYEIESMGKKYKANLFLSSPFDIKNQRPLGHYEQNAEETHFED